MTLDMPSYLLPVYLDPHFFPFLSSLPSTALSLGSSISASTCNLAIGAGGVIGRSKRYGSSQEEEEQGCSLPPISARGVQKVDMGHVLTSYRSLRSAFRPDGRQRQCAIVLFATLMRGAF